MNKGPRSLFPPAIQAALAPKALIAKLERLFSPAELAMALAFLAYVLANNGGFMNFNYHVHLAEAFLNGRLDVLAPPSWLTEFAFYQGKYYVYFGPMPAVLLAPFVAILHLDLNLARVAAGLGAINVALVWRLLERLGCSRQVTVWLTVAFAIGSVQFWVSAYGNTWLFAQLCASFFLLLGALEVLGKRRGWLVGLWLASAVLSREACLVALPFYLILLNAPRGSLSAPVPSRATLGFFGSLVALGSVDAWYNWARFGNILNNGYLFANQAIWHPPHGSFSLHYLITMLPVYVWRGPTFIPQWPYATLTDHGLSLFWTTPAFLLLIGAARMPWRRPLDRDAWVRLAAWATVLPMAGLYLVYFWDGWRQFGARYTLDYTPFILVLLGLYIKDKATWTLKALVVASVLINIWGMAYWRLSGW